jgi:hypothetical protein
VGISIYYTARRSTPLSQGEQAAIDELVRHYSVKKVMRERERTGAGPNWEDFCVYEPNEDTEPGVIFEGATRLPDSSEDDFWIGIQHWCRVLSLIRLVLPDALWDVAVDDHPIPWNAELGVFDPAG